MRSTRACPILHLVLLGLQVVSIGCILSWVIYSFEVILNNLDKIEPTLDRIEKSNFVFSKRMKMNSRNHSNLLEESKNMIFTIISLFFLLLAIHILRASMFLKTIYPCCPGNRTSRGEVIEAFEDTPNVIETTPSKENDAATVENTSLTINMEL